MEHIHRKNTYELLRVSKDNCFPPDAPVDQFAQSWVSQAWKLIEAQKDLIEKMRENLFNQRKTNKALQRACEFKSLKIADMQHRLTNLEATPNESAEN